MPKGPLSRVPWPGNPWMPFTFQPALQAFQQSHKHSHSLQQATHIELAHHYALIINFFHFFFKSKRISTKYRVATSKRCQATWKGRRPHQSGTPCLLILVATMGKSKLINEAN